MHAPRGRSFADVGRVRGREHDTRARRTPKHDPSRNPLAIDHCRSRVAHLLIAQMHRVLHREAFWGYHREHEAHMPTCKDIDTQIVDWLYDELDPPTQASFREHIDACATCAAEIASFSSIRELMRALPSEEPPLTCSNIILHEAGKRGIGAHSIPERDSYGIWVFIERLMRPVMAHPAVAAVASLLLIVSIGSTLYLRGDEQLSEPVLTSGEGMHSAITEAPASAADGHTGSGIGGQPLDDRELDRNQDGRVVDLAAAEDQDKLRAAKQVRLGGSLEGGVGDAREAGGHPRDTPTVDDRQRSEYRADSDETTARPLGEAAKRAPKRSRSSALPNKKAPIIEPKGAKAASGQSDEAADALGIGGANTIAHDKSVPTRQGSRSSVMSPMESSTREEQLRMSQPIPEPAASAPPAMDRSVRPSKADAPRTPTTISLAARHRELERALEARRCGEAAHIANDIMDQDRAYYMRNVRNRKSQSACSQEIIAETNARARRRAEAKRAKKNERTDTDEAAAEAVTAD